MTDSKWISAPVADLTVMLAGPVCFLALYFGEGALILSTVILWASLVLMDSGHVYLTYIRTIRERKELKKISVFLHLGLFFTLICFFYFKLPYLWHLVVYLTYFHFLRQFYGVYRRYLYLGGEVGPFHGPILNFFFYFLTILPSIAFHMRSDLGPIGYYANEDTFNFSYLEGYRMTLGIYFTTLAGWVFYETIYLVRNGRVEGARLLSMASTFGLFYLVFIQAQTKFQLIAPLVMAHGLQYYFFMGDHLKKQYKFKTKEIFSYLLLFGFLAGIVSSIWEDYLDLSYDYLLNSNPANNLAVSLILTFLLYHYFIDGVIWRRKYFSKLLTKSSTAGKSETSSRSK